MNRNSRTEENNPAIIHQTMTSTPDRSPVASAIEIDGLTVERGKRTVLPGIDLGIVSGAVTGLLGPSGSGKTTLMRAIVGVQIVADGRVRLLGEQAGTPALRRRVAYMTQSPSVYADLTMLENLGYFARVVGAPGERIQEVIETVGLGKQADQVVSTLSGGERARSSLAVALLGDPEILILDEPTVGLDPVLRQELWTTFHSLAGGGATLLVSTHVMDEADRCDQLVLMSEGEIVAAGTPDQLRERAETDDLERAFLKLAST